MPKMAEVTVTIVLYNSADHLEVCLESLKGDLDSGLAELVAVDNASPDGSAEIVERAAPGARVVRSAENRGFAGGCNRAWPFVSGRYWLLLNPDVVLEPDALAELVEFMDRHPRVAAVSPWLRDPASGDVLFPGRAFPAAWRNLLELSRIHLLLPGELRARLLQGPYVRHGARSAPGPDWIPGTAMLVRSETAREIGLLDESFFLYGEDLEWCWRMRTAGWALATSQEAVAVHHARGSGERTWSDQAVEERIAEGIVRACRRMRGPLRARAMALTTVAAYAIESWHPGRRYDSRARAAKARRAWWRALTHA